MGLGDGQWHVDTTQCPPLLAVERSSKRHRVVDRGAQLGEVELMAATIAAVGDEGTGLEDESALQIGDRHDRITGLRADRALLGPLQSPIATLDRYGIATHQAQQQVLGHVVGNHHVEHQVVVAEAMLATVVRRRLRREIEGGRGITASEQGVRIDQHIGDDVDVGGRSSRCDAFDMAVQSDHLAADEHPIGRLQMLGKLSQVRPQLPR
ncbi:MAG: hypothetical protein Q7V57_13770 [Actinomycetota bacterium]|nr:hypothetical protein [Actinomycetota bacterium]